MAVVRTLDRGDVLIPQVSIALSSQVFSRENQGGDGGKVKVVRFGDANMKIRKSNPAARKSFRKQNNYS